MPIPTVRLLDLSGQPYWETRDPARVEIIARFGAEDSTAKVTFHPCAPLPNTQVGDGLTITFGDITKFNGKVSELRRDSDGFPLVIRGAHRPRRMYRGEARGLFLDETPTAILEQLLDQSTGPVPFYEGLPASTRTVDRLDFQGLPLFYAIDLLARLAGNWLWWIDWEGTLRFVPSQSRPEHTWYFDPDTMALQPWIRDRSIKNLFRFRGGIASGVEFERYFDETASAERHGMVDETLYARPISTEEAFLYLREAVLDEAPWPTHYRAVDRWNPDLTAGFGERFQLRGALPAGMISGQTYRIAAEELTWTEIGFRARYHLAEGLESATRYTRYLDHEPGGEMYVQARLGPFQLDLSALNSEAHLDP